MLFRSKVAKRLVEKYHFQPAECPKLYKFDYVFTKEGYQPIVYVEIRCRNVEWGAYPTIFMNAMKFAHGMYAVRDGNKFLFVVQDKLKNIHWYSAKKEHLPKIRNVWGGRNNMRDPLDREWVVEIHIELFKPL